MGTCLPFARWRQSSSPQQGERTERQQAWSTSTWRYGSTSEASCSRLKNRHKSPRPTRQCLQLSLCFVGTVHVTNKVFGPLLVWTRGARALGRHYCCSSGTDSYADGAVAGSATRQCAASWWRKAGFNHLFSGKGVTLLLEVCFFHLLPPRFLHTEYSRTHHSEQCNRGALKKTHPACAFLEKAAGVPEAEKHTPQLSTM